MRKKRVLDPNPRFLFSHHIFIVYKKDLRVYIHTLKKE